jgi:hypothetical protein
MTDHDRDPDLEHSPYSGAFTDHGITVTVNIFRVADGDEGWSLEVVDSVNTSTVWDEVFETDKAAYEEFLSAVRREGILVFATSPKRDFH